MNSKGDKNIIKRGIIFTIFILLSQQLYWIAAREHNPTLMFDLYSAIYLIILGLTGRWFVSFSLLFVVFKTVRTASIFRFDYMGDGLMGNDIFNTNLRDLLETISQYPEIIKDLAILSFIFIALLTITCICDTTRVRRAIRAFLFLTGIIMISCIYIQANKNPTTIINTRASFMHILTTFYEDSYLVNKDIEGDSKLDIACPTNNKNIAIILEESTFNPFIDPNYDKLITQLSKTSKEFFNGNLLSLPLHVHTYGGATWLSEFAFLTGLPHNVYRGNNRYNGNRTNALEAFSLPAIFKKCGYNTIALVPGRATLFRMDEFYKSIGIDKIFGFNRNEYGGWSSLSDDLVFNKLVKIINEEKAKNSAPLFIYALTIKQHGPHDKKNPPQDYLTRLDESAKAFDNLKNKLDNSWVIGWFGDHQPAFTAYNNNTNLYTTFLSFYSHNKEAKWIGYNPKKQIDIAFMPYIIAINMGFNIGPVELEYKKAIKECQDNFHHCSQNTLDNLYRTYLKYVIRM